jgi:hypothetical protein
MAVPERVDAKADVASQLLPLCAVFIIPCGCANTAACPCNFEATSHKLGRRCRRGIRQLAEKPMLELLRLSLARKAESCGWQTAFQPALSQLDDRIFSLPDPEVTEFTDVLLATAVWLEEMKCEAMVGRVLFLNKNVPASFMGALQKQLSTIRKDILATSCYVAQPAASTAGG